MYRGESKGGGGAPGEFFNSAESLITKKKRICPWNALKYELFPQVRVSVKKVCFRSYVKTNSSSSCPCQFFVAILFFFFFFNLPMPCSCLAALRGLRRIEWLVDTGSLTGPC